MNPKYDIVAKYHYHELVDEVNKRLKEGWVLQGGVATDSKERQTRYFQAMIKTDK